MAKLCVYFDESYNQRTRKDPNTPLIYTVGGYISSVPQWKAFKKEWNKSLNSVGIPYFHMADFESRIGFYKDWSNEKRVDFLQNLHSIIHKYVLKGFTTSIILEDYNKLTDNQKYVFGEPHLCAFISCMKHIKLMCDEFYLSEPISYVLENNPHYDGKLTTFFSEISEETKKGYRFGSLTFAKKNCTPIQASDILAYEVNKEIVRQKNSDNVRSTRLSIKNLAVSRIDTWIYMEKEHFLSAIDFIKENGLNDGILEL